MGPNSISKAMAAASQGMGAQAYRLQVVSENLSNADTHGYKRKLITFENVDMMIELADAREAGRSYDANLSTFKQATQMYSSLLTLLRR